MNETKLLIVSFAVVTALGFLINSAYAEVNLFSATTKPSIEYTGINQLEKKEINKHLEIINFMIEELRELEGCYTPNCEIVFNGTHFIKFVLIDGEQITVKVSEELDTEESKDSDSSDSDSSDSSSSDSESSDNGNNDDVIYEDSCPTYSPYNYGCVPDGGDDGTNGKISEWYNEIYKIYPNFYELEHDFPDPWDHLEGDLAHEKKQADKQGLNYLPELLDDAVKEFDEYEPKNDGYDDIDKEGNILVPNQDRQDVKNKQSLEEFSKGKTLVHEEHNNGDDEYLFKNIDIKSIDSDRAIIDDSDRTEAIEQDGDMDQKDIDEQEESEQDEINDEQNTDNETVIYE